MSLFRYIVYHIPARLSCFDKIPLSQTLLSPTEQAIEFHKEILDGSALGNRLTEESFSLYSFQPQGYCYPHPSMRKLIMTLAHTYSQVTFDYSIFWVKWKVMRNVYALVSIFFLLSLEMQRVVVDSVLISSYLCCRWENHSFERCLESNSFAVETMHYHHLTLISASFMRPRTIDDPVRDGGGKWHEWVMRYQFSYDVAGFADSRMKVNGSWNRI